MVKGRRAGQVLLLSWLAAVEGQASPCAFEQIEGDYRLDVLPEPLGFLVRDGGLFLKQGGLASEKPQVPLVVLDDGRYALAKGHPNAFSFDCPDEGGVRFTLWSMGQAIPGRRSEPPNTGPSAPAPEYPSTSAASPPATEVGDPRRRSVVEAELAAARRSLALGTSADLRATIARLAFEVGRFEEAVQEFGQAGPAEKLAPESALLAARAELLTGRSEEAERRLRGLLARPGLEAGVATRIRVELLFLLYQAGRFADLAALEFPAGVALPTLDIARALTKNPYRLEWTDATRTSRIPLVDVDPLPSFEIEVQGVPIQVLLDTGADLLTLDSEIARALGVASVSRASGTFAGGLPGDVEFGTLEKVRLGSALLRDVPVMMMPTKRFSFNPGKMTVGGIAGVALLRQFLATVDYAGRQIVLREPTAGAVEDVRRAAGDKRLEEVPFAVDATHLLLARGRVGDDVERTLFVDSGLASSASVAVPLETLVDLKIPVPERKQADGDVGGGGGKVATGSVVLSQVHLGGFGRRDVSGVYGPIPPNLFRSRGTILDALLSHGFLRQANSWTLDFVSRRFLFDLPAGDL